MNPALSLYLYLVTGPPVGLSLVGGAVWLLSKFV